MHSRRLLLTLLLSSIFFVFAMPNTAQESTDPIVMLADAGYDGFYRAGYWMPIQVQVSNDGASVAGRITVRPETSGRVVNSSYSTPIDLPTGSDKTAFLYVEVNPGASSLVVELIDDEGVRISERTVGLSSIDSHDSLHVVVSGTGASTIPLNGIAEGGYLSRQARWELDHLPPELSALQAIDTLIFYDVQTDQLTVDQLEAIEAWILTGGHLIIVGGPSWAQTASGLGMDYLPFMPTASENIEGLSALAGYIGLDDALPDRTFVTTGNVADSADVLISTDDGLPLVIRNEHGSGVVDYLTVDPTLEPLRSWLGLQDLWFYLLSGAPPNMGWQQGFVELQDAARALAILPNVDLLPPVTSMIAFIVAYILLVGPVNYFVLSRLGKRAWGWFTIPLFITAFTLLAWNVGFNLRGSEIILSRLYAVQSFADSNVAYQDQLIGVLSPRRDVYNVAVPEDTFLRVLPALESDTVFSSSVSRTTAEIVQSGQFQVEDIAIDGGIFANFSTSTLVERPDISGNITFSYVIGETSPEDPNVYGQALLGVVRNDSDITLENAVILTNDRFYRLDSPLEPGAIVNFDSDDFNLIDLDVEDRNAVASPLMTVAGLDFSIWRRNNSIIINESLVSTRVILGNIEWSSEAFQRNDLTFTGTEDEETNRRQAFLASFMRDQYATNGILDGAYLIGWTNAEQPLDVDITDATYRTVDTTVHIIELETTTEIPPSTETVTLSPNQFTWVTRDVAQGQVLGSVHELTLINPGYIEFQFTPTDTAMLDEVTGLQIELDRQSSYGREVDLNLWNWDTQEWDLFSSGREETIIVNNHEPYIGANNDVRISLILDEQLAAQSASGRIRDLRVIMTGNF